MNELSNTNNISNQQKYYLNDVLNLIREAKMYYL